MHHNGKKITIVECPRDAMQGWPIPIATSQKTAYLQALLEVGFETLDCVSFVSPKAIPQMADSAEVLNGLNLQQSSTQLLAIVLNSRGAQAALAHAGISFLGYPFSISETFQQRNGNSTIEQSWERLISIQQLCVQYGRQLVVYLSMGFGNPYGDPYHEGIIGEWIEKMDALGIKIIALADTIGLATPAQVYTITKAAVSGFAHLEIGVHLHTTPAGFEEKMDAALLAGCTRFDGALRGIGGCPMAGNSLVGNMDTEQMATYLLARGLYTGLNMDALRKASALAGQVFAHS